MLSRDVLGAVIAVVGNDDHPVGRPGLPPQRRERGREGEPFVVRRDQHREAQPPRGGVSVGLVRRDTSRQGVVVEHPDGGGAERSEHACSGSAQRRRKRIRDSAVTREHPHRGGGVQGGQSDEHRLRAYDPTLAVAAGDDTVAQLLSPYATAADVLGADTYPIGTGQPLDRVGFIARNVKAVASRAHRRSAVVLQAFSWSDYPKVGPWPAPRWPSRSEMRQMRDLAIRAADPSLILWYSYFDIRNSADAAKHWRDLVWAAHGT